MVEYIRLVLVYKEESFIRKLILIKYVKKGINNGGEIMILILNVIIGENFKNVYIVIFVKFSIYESNVC